MPFLPRLRLLPFGLGEVVRPGEGTDRAAVGGIGEELPPLPPREVAVGDLPRLGPPGGGITIEPHYAAVDAAVLVSRGAGAPRAEGHARDTALLDLDRVGPQPLPLGVEQHHTADAAVAALVSPPAAAPRAAGPA